MKYLSAILFLFLLNSVKAQPPRIDSIRIDESKGLLLAYGNFGATIGDIWCDSVELGVVSWKDTVIVAAIPDTGKGSAGQLLVEVNGERSNSVLITLWKAKWFTEHHTGSGDISGRNIDTLTFAFRTALEVS